MLLYVESVVYNGVVFHLFIHLPGDGHLDCLQFLAFINKTAVNIQVQVFFCESIFLFVFGKYQEVGYLGCAGIVYLIS